MAYSVQALQKYLDHKLRASPDMNLFFDTYYAAVKAWNHILDKQEMEELVAVMAADNIKDGDFRAQLAYYSQTIDRVCKV